jgi:hypothetical protein
MAYSLVRTRNAEYSIDWKTVYGIIRSHHRARLQYENAQEIRESQSPWYVPTLLGGMPDLWYVSVDWKRVEQAGQDAFIELAPIFYNISSSSLNVDRLVERLRFAQIETRRYNELYAKLARQASEKSFAAIESNLATLDTAVSTARWIRDISGSILIGAASAPAAAFGATAGAGTLVLVGAGGTVIKTVAKYQDTGNMGVAAVEATANIISTVIPVFPRVKSALGGYAPAAVDRVKVVISAVSDTLQAFIKGDSPGVALAVGTAAAATGTGGDAIKTQLKKLTESAAVPISVKVGKDVSKKLLQGAARDLLRDGEAGQVDIDIRGGYENYARTSAHVDLPGRTNIQEPAGVADATISDEWLVKLAVVDMSKGIGHSWW